MTPTRISELPKELRELAEQRTRESKMPFETDLLVRAFLWYDTPEGHHFWSEVDNRNYEKVLTLKFKEA